MATTSGGITPTLSMNLLNFAAESPESWEPLLDRAVSIERAGVDRVIVSDHIAFGENLDAYGDPSSGGVEGGRQPTGPDGAWLEPLTVLAAVAGRTTRVRLATGILIASLRRPAVLAKTAATIDAISGGRLDLGVGVGWQREEYEAAGLAFEGRGKLLDHTLAVLQTFWTEQAAGFSDDRLAFERIHQAPKPVQAGGVPIWVSGRLHGGRADNAVLRRIVRFGSGWIPWGDDAQDPAPAIARIREALAEAGRDPAGFQVQGALAVPADAGVAGIEQALESALALNEAGVTDFQVFLRCPDHELEDRLTPIVSTFQSAFA